MLLLRKGDYTFLPRPLRKKKFNSASFMVRIAIAYLH